MKALVLMATALLTAAAGGGAVAVDTGASAPAVLVSPARPLEAAANALSERRPEEAWERARAALRRVPWYGPGWVALAASLEAWFGSASALPFYELAVELDPAGRRTWRAAAPRLLRAGWWGPDSALEALARSGSPAVAAALPVSPPASWSPAAGMLTPGAARLLRRAGRDAWLAAAETSAEAAELTPAARSLTLAAWCDRYPAQCTSRLERCRRRREGCDRGVEVGARLAAAVRDAARASGQAATAVTWARRAMRLEPRTPNVRAYAEALAAAGETTRAHRLRRTHPALAE